MKEEELQKFIDKIVISPKLPEGNLPLTITEKETYSLFWKDYDEYFKLALNDLKQKLNNFSKQFLCLHAQHFIMRRKLGEKLQWESYWNEKLNIKPKEGCLAIRIYDLGLFDSNVLDLGRYKIYKFSEYSNSDFWKSFDLYEKNCNKANRPECILEIKDIAVNLEDRDKTEEKVSEEIETFRNIFTFMSNMLSNFVLFHNKPYDTICVFSYENQFVLCMASKDDKERHPVNISCNNLLKQNENIIKIINKKAPSDLEKRILLAIKWFGRSVRTKVWSDKYIFLATALECLLQYDGDGVFRASNVASFSEDIAFLISNNYEERIKIYNAIKQFYKIRSAIIHGEKKQKEMMEFLDEKKYICFVNYIGQAIYAMADLSENTECNSISDIYDNYFIKLKFRTDPINS